MSMTKSEAAYEALLQAIKTGRLKAGQKVTLLELSQELGMSMTPVRDALTQLAEQGLVVRKPHHASVIAEHMISRSSEVSMIRAIVEPEAAKLAALRASADEIAELAAICDGSERAAHEGDIRELRRLNQSFHLRVGKVSGSPMLAEFIEKLWKNLPVQGFTLSGRTSSILCDHRSILDALMSRDGGRASELMGRHIGTAAELTAQFLSSVQLP